MAKSARMSSYTLIYHYKNDNLHFTDRNRVNMFLNNQENKLMKWKIIQTKLHKSMYKVLKKITKTKTPSKTASTNA